MMIDDTKALMRVRYPFMKRFLLHLSENSGTPSSISSDVLTVGELLGFLQVNDTPILTPKGRELVSACEKGQQPVEKRFLKEAFEGNRLLKLHWAMICDGRAQFTTNDLVEVFRELGYTEPNEDSLKMSIRVFLSWAKAAGLCVKGGVQGHTYTILQPMGIGRPSEPALNGMSVSAERPSSEVDTHTSLLRLNSYVCDHLLGQAREGDFEVIQEELGHLRNDDLLDSLVVDMLEREVKKGLETKSQDILVMAAQSIKSLRERYDGRSKSA